jgi:hypothetical protein
MQLQFHENGLITTGPETCLGNLVHIDGRTYDASVGLVDVTREQAGRHNLVLAEAEMEHMRRGGQVLLYLDCEPAHYARRPEGRRTLGEITNFAGTVKFRCHTRVGRHNIAGCRYDCYFKGPDGREWHGVRYGDNTSVVHCKPTKRAWQGGIN